MQYLQRMSLEIGHGENRFSMKRGSFRYKEKISYMEKMTPEKITDFEKEGLYRMFFRDKTGLEHLIEVRRQHPDDAGSNLLVKYIGKEIPGKPFDEWVPDPNINRYVLAIPCGKDEHFYGCGETYSSFDLKGRMIRIWVAEHQNSDRISRKLIRQKLFGKKPEKIMPYHRYESYYAQPTFTSSKKYFIHVYTDAYAKFDFTEPGEIKLKLQEPPNLVGGGGDTFTEVSERLSEIIGRQSELPDWIYDGAILAIQEGPDVIEAKLKKAHDAGALISGIWCQDWCGCRRTRFGYQVMWNWDYDKELYPELPSKIIEWKERGIHFLGYINPFMAVEKEIYKEASAKGYCVRDRSGKDYFVTITTFPAAMIDFTNPEAYEWYKAIIKKNLIDIGMSGWMADFGEYLPTDCVLHDGSDPELMHNRWPAIWARMNREAIQESGKEGEIFFFTRAGHTETVEHSTMMWTGDHHVDWSVDDGIPSVIPATLSLAMSGYGVTHSDVGGYTTIMDMRRTKELLLRWEEMNVFSPLWRSHEGNQPVNSVQFDEDDELLSHMASCSRMHAALKPYLKMLLQEAVSRGTPVIRPLFYHFDEPEAYKIKTEYLLGEDLLVAPIIVEGATSRRVYLPEGEWIHLFTGKSYNGGKYRIDAPIGEPPVFVRKDSKSFERDDFLNRTGH